MVLDLVGPILSTALVCAREGLSVPVGRILVAPGGVPAWDACCDGMLWTRLIEMLPAETSASSRFTATPTAPCGVLLWQATLGVGLLRCAVVGEAPPVAALTAEALGVTRDAAELSAALQCCLAGQVAKLRMLRWDPLGPDGGCVGGEWQVTTLVDNCACPDA